MHISTYLYPIHALILSREQRRFVLFHWAWNKKKVRIERDLIFWMRLLVFFDVWLIITCDHGSCRVQDGYTLFRFTLLLHLVIYSHGRSWEQPDRSGGAGDYLPSSFVQLIVDPHPLSLSVACTSPRSPRERRPGGFGPILEHRYGNCRPDRQLRYLKVMQVMQVMAVFVCCSFVLLLFWFTVYLGPNIQPFVLQAVMCVSCMDMGIGASPMDD